MQDEWGAGSGDERVVGTVAVRCLGVWLAATGAAGLLTCWVLPDLRHRSSGGVTALVSGPFDELLVAGCEGAALVGVTWLWTLVSLVALDALRGRGAPRPGVPPSVHRIVLLACGLGLASGLGVPAHAGTPGRPAAPSGGTTSLLGGLPLPDRATAPLPDPPRGARGPLPPPRSAAQPSREHTPREVVVEAGDSLWSLAAAHLPAGAAPAEVDAYWRELHARNRAVIGDDPDVIHPGVRLRLPPGPAPTT